MMGPKVQEFLDGLVEGMEREKPTDVPIEALRERLVAYFSPIDGVILEYERNAKLAAPYWKPSQRNPLAFKDTGVADGTVSINFGGFPNRRTTIGFKHLYANNTEFAFLSDEGLYVAMGWNVDDGFFTVDETIYVPETTVQALQNI